MKQKTLAALIGAAFFLMLGIVGAVEQGAPLARLLWLLPLLAALIVCGGKYVKYSGETVSKAPSRRRYESETQKTKPTGGF